MSLVNKGRVWGLKGGENRYCAQSWQLCPASPIPAFLFCAGTVYLAATGLPWGTLKGLLVSSISDRLAVMPSMLIASLSGKFSFLPRWKLFLVGLGFFYALSPLDFIPELFFGPFGLADDAAIVALCLSVLFRAADEFVSPGVIKGETIPGETVPRDAAAPSGEVISGEVISSKPA